MALFDPRAAVTAALKSVASAVGVSAFCLFVLASGSAALAAPQRQRPIAPDQPARGEAISVRLFDLSAVRRQCAPLAARGPAVGDDRQIAAWTECSLVSQAVFGDASAEPFTFDELVRSAKTGATSLVIATHGLAARDAVAYQLLALGYSARETADVVSGRISKRALDTAWRMIATGQGREAAADYLDREYAQRLASMRPVPRPSPAAPTPSFSAFDALIDQYAQLHQVQPAIVRAIIATESAFNPASRSPAGAIGLMQLMPATARDLGVNPFIPAQNLEGGVRYFSHLLREFGGLELALVAYNAGPGFAQRYARGGIALYGETRAYVRSVLGRLAHPA